MLCVPDWIELRQQQEADETSDESGGGDAAIDQG